MKKNFFDRRINLILGILVLGTLAVLFYLGRYNVMAADDYTYGLASRRAWLETGSLWEVIKTAFQTVALSLAQWQGTYSSLFLMRLNPGILNERLTILISFIMLIPYCGAIVFFFRQIGKRFFSGNPNAITTISLCTIFVTLQTLYDPSEAVYWFNGAIHYMFMQSLLLIWMGILLKLDGENKAVEPGKKKYVTNIFWILAGCVIALVAAGGNFISVLQGLILSVVYLGIRMFQKKFHWKCLLPWAAFVVGAVLNLSAPGNAIRKEVTVGYSPIKSILYSLRYGEFFMAEWTGWLMVLSILLLLPFIWRAVGKTERRYPYPLLFAAFSYGVFSAMLTPLFYGMADVFIDRALNIVKVMYYVIVVINVMYVTGWIRYKAEHGKGTFFADVKSITDIVRKYKNAWIGCSICLMLALMLLEPDKNTYTVISAMRSLGNGEARNYYVQELEREELYYDTSQPVLYLKAIENPPYVLFNGDIYPDGTHGYWINQGIAEFYGKEAIHLKQEE